MMIDHTDIRMVRNVTRFTVHAEGGQQTTPRDIEHKHRAKGRLSIGYHYLITPSGALVAGRPLRDPSGVDRQWNREAVSICLVGLGKRKVAKPNLAVRPQLRKLLWLFAALQGYWPKAEIINLTPVNFPTTS